MLLTFRGWDETRTVTPPHGQDRTADLVAILDEPATQREWLLIVEIQAEHEPEKLEVTLQEVAALRLQARPNAHRDRRYAVLASMIYLQGTCPNATLEMVLPNGAGTKHTALVWNVATDDAMQALNDVANNVQLPELLYWVPLMAGAEIEANVVRWKELVFERLPTARQRGNMLGIAWVFSELAGRGQVWKRVMENLDMMESQVVSGWINQGIATGNLEHASNAILRLLKKKFKMEVPTEIVQLVNQQSSLTLLDDWLDAVFEAATFEQFIAYLQR